MSQIETMIQKVVTEVRSSNAIVIIGAGVSFRTGMPLTGQLAPMLWMTYDEHPDLKQILADNLGESFATAKSLIGDDWNRMKKAFEIISTNNSAIKTFQYMFSKLDAERASKQSSTHEAIARLVHDGFIEKIVSLNWDTLIEQAWRRLYGTNINDDMVVLHKPHGDALNPNQNWVLPHAPGYISSEILDFLSDMYKERPRTLIIIGYSENDDIVVQDLIAPIQERWRVIRIRPGAVGKDDLPLPAEQVLPVLADSLCSKTTGWRHLTFSNQRSIASAIAGVRLSPADVNSCPRLPQVNIASTHLEISHYVEITGVPGCGKSITSYQIAYDYMNKGWEVLLAEGNRDSEDTLLAFVSNLNRKTVLIIDDAQNYSNSFLTKLIDLSSTILKVIITTTEQVISGQDKIIISNFAAVQSLRNTYLMRRDEILPIVRELDEWIGERYHDISIENRIEEAGKAESPWHFNFILRGGWQRANEELMILRDLDGADLLLVSIAIKQFLNTDAAIELEWLYSVTKHFNKDDNWLHRALEVLKNRKLLLSGNQIRTPHIRFAHVVIQRFFKYAESEEYDLMVELIRKSIIDFRTSLLGIYWLLNDVRFLDELRYRKNSVVNEQLWDSLLQRCLITNVVERRDAAFVLNVLAHMSATGHEKLIEQLAILAKWIESADDNSAYALGRLINDIFNYNKKAASNLVSLINPSSLAKRLSEARAEGAYTWGSLLGRIRLGTNDKWSAEFVNSIDKERLVALITNMTDEDIEAMSELIIGVACFDQEFAFQLLDSGFDKISTALQKRPLEAWMELREINWLLLGRAPHFLRRRRPNGRQNQYSKRIAKKLPVQKIAHELSRSRQRDWENYAHFLGEWLSEVDQRVYSKIINSLNYEKLGEMTEGLWAIPPRELRLLLMTLSDSSDNEPAKTMIREHEFEIKEIDPILTFISPETAVTVVRNGGKVNFFGHNGHDWDLIAKVIICLKELDEKAYRTSMEDNFLRFTSSLSNLQKIDCERLIPLLKILEDVDSLMLMKLIDNINVDQAEKTWGLRLDENASAKRTVAALVRYASMCSGDVKEMARRLEKRIPTKYKVKE